MKAFGRRLVASPIRVAELCAAAVLFFAATAAFAYLLGGLLLFLMPYSYLRDNGFGR